MSNRAVASTNEKNMENKTVKIVNLINSNQTPINFMDGLALLLIGLKLGTNSLEHWTWIEVLMPLWAPIMLAWFLRLVATTFTSDIDDTESDKKENE